VSFFGRNEWVTVLGVVAGCKVEAAFVFTRSDLRRNPAEDVIEIQRTQNPDRSEA
jgi:hypothetical protein